MALALIATFRRGASSPVGWAVLSGLARGGLATQKRAGKTEGHGHEPPHREVVTMTRLQVITTVGRPARRSFPVEELLDGEDRGG